MRLRPRDVGVGGTVGILVARGPLTAAPRSLCGVDAGRLVVPATHEASFAVDARRGAGAGRAGVHAVLVATIVCACRVANTVAAEPLVAAVRTAVTVAIVVVAASSEACRVAVPVPYHRRVQQNVQNI